MPITASQFYGDKVKMTAALSAICKIMAVLGRYSKDDSSSASYIIIVLRRYSKDDSSSVSYM
jgi:hypothetical protein